MRRLLITIVLAACGGGAEPPPGPDASDPPRLPDATIQVCTVPNECPCFSNDDCPESTRCHAEDETMVYCEPGERGTGAAGTTCTGELDCESALCVDGTDTMRCSKICTDDTECPAELPRCLAGIGICARSL